MAVFTETKSAQQIAELKERLAPHAKRETQPQYTYWQLKLEECTVTAYTSGKVVWQGADLDWLIPERKETVGFPQAGSDEVGTGDYFGPVVVASCIVDEKAAPMLEKLGITDSKKMTDDIIRKVAPVVSESCPHSILIVMPEKYNEVQKSHNMVDMKCLLHNKAWLNLRDKGYTIPKTAVVDQFVSEKSYYRYLKDTEAYRPLIFETKAESKYLAVAAASVLARARFLEAWDRMEAHWDMKFAKGAGSAVDADGRRFIERYGRENLGLVAKLHFKNTQKL